MLSYETTKISRARLNNERTGRAKPRDNRWLDEAGPLGGVLDRKREERKKSDVILIDDDEPQKSRYGYSEGSRKRTAAAADMPPSSYYPKIDPRIPPPNYSSSPAYSVPPPTGVPPPTTGYVTTSVSKNTLKNF